MALVKYNDRSLRNLSTVPAAVTGNAPGALVHIKTLTASSSATLSFVDGASSVVLDNTYPIYKFEFIDIHPASDNVDFQFNMSTDTGSNYNVTKTTNGFQAYLNEGDSANGLAYESGRDLAQSTDFQGVLIGVGNEADQCCAGQLHLFNPSSTTFVKHFISKGNNYRADTESQQSYFAGYGNTTSAVDAIQFKMSSGNIDAGQIKLYGIKDA